VGRSLSREGGRNENGDDKREKGRMRAHD
jgi:hypothetical protein